MPPKSKPPVGRQKKPTGGRKAKKAGVRPGTASAVVGASPESGEGTEGNSPLGRGRPPKYSHDFARQAEKLCALGATDKELADFFEVNTTTIWRWRSEYEDFCNALRIGKGATDERVERSLYLKAIGYSFDAEKIMQHNGVPIRVPYTEHVPPDPVACKFWLVNRKQNEWREKQEVNVTADEAFVNMWKLISSGKNGSEA